MSYKNYSTTRKTRNWSANVRKKGETIKADICFSAAGAYKPPMLVFLKMLMQQVFLNWIEPGGWVKLNDRGWIDMKLFFVQSKKFVEIYKVSKKSPIHLLQDGHCS